MARHPLTFQADAVDLAAAVDSLLAKECASPAWDETAGDRPLWLRAWLRGLRLIGGTKRWEHRKMASKFRHLMADSTKPLLVYVVPFDVWKLRTGGGQRIAGIAKAASRDFNVLVLTSAWSVRAFAWHELGPNCHVLAVPTGAGFMERVRAGQGAGLFAFVDHFGLLEDFRRTLALVSGFARAWGLVHPIAWPAIQPLLRPEQPTFYDAHDDYAQFLQHAYGQADARLVDRILDMERHVLERVGVAAFCTEGDRAAVLRRNPACKAGLLVVPNGVDVVACRAVWPSQARQRRLALGLTRPLVLFMGSIHKPNREAAEFIARELAPAFPQVLFVVMGMDLAAFRAAGHAADGANLAWTGPVSEQVKEALFSLADVALAPLVGGTGSSLKIPDYVAHGKIVVATPMGLRGVEELARFSSVVSDQDVPGALAGVLKRLDEDPGAYDSACRQAREWVANTLDWCVAAKPLVEAMGAGGGDCRP